MGSVLSSSAVDLGFEPLSGQTKDYKIGICCFSTTQKAKRMSTTDPPSPPSSNQKTEKTKKTTVLYITFISYDTRHAYN
jgi:hypothetical protein